MQADKSHTSFICEQVMEAKGMTLIQIDHVSK
jgi:hypothetical protein